jgi:hypothetical protein
LNQSEGLFDSALQLLTTKDKEKTVKHRRNTVSVIALAMIMLVTNLAYAEGPAKGPDKKTVLRAELRAVIAATPKGGQEQDRYSQEELEQTRSALLDLASSVKDLTELAPDTFDTGTLDEATRQLAELSYKQLGTLRKVLNPAKVSERLATARATVAEYKLSVQREGRVQVQSAGRKKGGAVGISSAGFPIATGFCGANGPSRIPVGVMLAADIVYFIAEGVRDIAQDGCNEVLVVLGEGGNARALCLITDAVYLIAHGVDFALHFCDDDLTGNIIDANYARLDHIHTDLENSVANDNTNTANIVANDNSNKAMIITNDNTNTANIVANDNTNRALIITNDNTNTANIIANDNANTTTILNNANANKNELRDLILRTQIEADLASTDGSTFVAAYFTPNANGGYLDLVMTIVTQTLANIQAAGGNIGNAQMFLNQANAAKAAGDFKGAYTLYRKAYKMAGK